MKAGLRPQFAQLPESWTLLLEATLQPPPFEWPSCSEMKEASCWAPCSEPGLTLPARVHMDRNPLTLKKWIHKGYVRDALLRQRLLPKAGLHCL